MDNIYQVVNNPEIGLSIQKQKKSFYDKIQKKTIYKNDEFEYVLWIDEFEGGEAYVTDWTSDEVFDTEESAFDYIKDKWGEILKIEF